LNTGQWDKWCALFGDNIVIDEAISGHMEGIQAVRESVEGIKNGFSFFRNDIVEIVVEDDKGMIVCDLKATLKNGATIESRGANFYRMKGNKIMYMSSFHDKTPFINALGGAK
jgi:hypothetical protein